MEHEHETPELDQEFDPVFEEEQQHLTETYAKLQTMGRDLLADVYKRQSQHGAPP